MLLVIYVVASRGGDGYLDPVGRAVAFLHDLPTRLLAMLGELMAVLLVPARKRASRETRGLLGWSALGAAGSPLPLAASPTGSRHLIVPFNGYFLRTLNGQPMPERWRILSAASFTHCYRSTASDTLELEFPGLEVTVLQVNETGPTRVRFSFDRPLEDPSLRFMAIVGGELRPIQPPPPSEAMDLPGKMGTFHFFLKYLHLARFRGNGDQVYSLREV